MVITTEMYLQKEAEILNEALSDLSAQARMRYIVNYAQRQDHHIVQTTSFGIQSALMIHLSQEALSSSDEPVVVCSKIPIVWIDTGYLPNETYHFASNLVRTYGFDLRAYQAKLSPARMEALYGKLWEDPSDEAHKKYNYIRKVEPMQRALKELNASIVMSGVRSSQTQFRKQMKIVEVQDGRLKVSPILDWTDEDVSSYFESQKVPFHPLREKGYRSVGDSHSSQPFDPSIHKNERETRFNGRTQECGLHLSISSVSLNDSEHTPSLSGSSVSQTEDFTMVGEDGFVVFGRPSCKYCRAAKELLETVSKTLDRSITKVEVEVGREISKEVLEDLVGQTVKTVPQIFYMGMHIGGYDDLVEWTRRTYAEDAIQPILNNAVVGGTSN